MTRTCDVIVMMLLIVLHDSRLWSYDVMSFAHDSHYESWVSLMWCELRTWLIVWVMIRLGKLSSWLVRVSWWISHYDSLWVIEVMRLEETSHQGLGFVRNAYISQVLTRVVSSSRNHLSTFLYYTINSNLYSTKHDTWERDAVVSLERTWEDIYITR